METLKKQLEERLFKYFSGPCCGLCRKFHKLDCCAENVTSIRRKRFVKSFFSKPLNENCFEPREEGYEGALNYILNIHEHDTVHRELLRIINLMAFNVSRPPYVKDIKAENVWVKNQCYVKASLKIDVGIDLKGVKPQNVELYFYIRNYASRTIEFCDIPKLFKTGLADCKEIHHILIAPQTPPIDHKYFYMAQEKYNFHCWETQIAYKTPERKVKWASRVEKKLKETSYLNDIALVLLEYFQKFLAQLVSEFLQLRKMIYPSLVEEALSRVFQWSKSKLYLTLTIPLGRGPP